MIAQKVAPTAEDLLRLFTNGSVSSLNAPIEFVFESTHNQPAFDRAIAASVCSSVGDITALYAETVDPSLAWEDFLSLLIAVQVLCVFPSHTSTTPFRAASEMNLTTFARSALKDRRHAAQFLAALRSLPDGSSLQSWSPSTFPPQTATEWAQALANHPFAARARLATSLQEAAFLLLKAVIRFLDPYRSSPLFAARIHVRYLRKTMCLYSLYVHRVGREWASSKLGVLGTRSKQQRLILLELYADDLRVDF